MFHFLRSLLPDSRMGLRHVFGLGVLLFLGSLPASWAIRTTLAVRELQSAGCFVEPVATWIDKWPGELSTPIRVMVGGVECVEINGKYLADTAKMDRLIRSLSALNRCTTLFLSDVYLTDQQMRNLCCAIGVENLHMRNCRLEGSPFEGLGNNISLRYLVLSNSIRAGTQLEGLGKCRRLEKFYLWNCSMIDGELQELGNCDSIRHMWIDYCSFPTEVELPVMQNLLSLTLRDTKLNCDALRKSSPNTRFLVQNRNPDVCRFVDIE